MMVNRCVCRDVTFARLKALAAEHGWGLEELSRSTGCGTVCGLCRPYIRVMLATGRTEVPVASEEVLRRMEEAAQAGRRGP